MTRYTTLALAGLLLFCPPIAAAATVVFINEIHYDNTSIDQGEAIEIAGPAGTDLGGWRLDLYNGNGGVLYSSATLSGVLPDQQNGYGVLAFGFNAIQNGPDGIALVDAGGTVRQFLSYEGSVSATEGAAAGNVSLDIGVTEDPGSPVGSSLQLAGNGATYEDFLWSASQAATFGAPNTGQTFVPIPAALWLLISGLSCLGLFARRHR